MGGSEVLVCGDRNRQRPGGMQVSILGLGGTVVEFVSFIFYTLKDGKIWRIRVARYPGPVSDFP